MLKNLKVLDMDRLVMLEHEIDKLRQKFKYVDELHHRVSNLENWITANVGWGLQSSHHRGLSLPQLPESSPTKIEVKNSTVSSIVITKVLQESDETSSKITSISLADAALKPLLLRPVDQSEELKSSGTRNQISTKQGAIQGEDITTSERNHEMLQIPPAAKPLSSSSCVSSSAVDGKMELDKPVIRGNETDDSKKTEFQCSKCNASFSHPVAFAKHKLKHKLFRCSQCPRKFVENLHLLQHIRDVHSGVQQPSLNKGTTTSAQMKQKNEKSVANLSSGQFQIKGPSLPSHHLNQRNPAKLQAGGMLEKMRHGGMQQAAQASGRNGSLSDSWNQGGRWIGAGKLNTFQRSYRCTCCGKIFAKLRNLREHMISHENDLNQGNQGPMNGGS